MTPGYYWVWPKEIKIKGPYFSRGSPPPAQPMMDDKEAEGATSRYIKGCPCARHLCAVPRPSEHTSTPLVPYTHHDMWCKHAYKCMQGQKDGHTHQPITCSAAARPHHRTFLRPPGMHTARHKVPTACRAEVLQDAGQGPAAEQIGQRPGTAGDQQGVIAGTWGTQSGLVRGQLLLSPRTLLLSQDS